MSGSGTRNWYQNPGQDGTFWVQPFQTTAQWTTSGANVTLLRNGSFGTPTGNINLKGNFASPWYIGSASDPLVQVTNGTKTINVHIPLGSAIETPASQFDQTIGGADSTQPYLVWSISGATMNTGTVAASGSVITGTYGMQIDDGAGPIMMDVVTGQQGTNNSIGGIQDYELSQANANASYVIQHMLAIQLDPSQVNSTLVWPLLVVDTSSSNTGTLPQGQTYGIPASTVRPTGKTRGFYLLFDNAQQFGWFYYNVAGAGCLTVDVYSSLPANASLVTDIQNNISAVMGYLCILSNQTGLSSQKGAAPGGVNAFPAPGILNLTATGGVEVAPSSFGAWYPSGYNVTPTGVSAAPSLTITTPPQQNANASFGLSGTILGYSSPPTLNYEDDSGSFLVLPVGNSVTATAFSFTNPGLPAGAHHVTVRDANNTAVAVSTGTFNVVAVVAPVITPTAPSLPVTADPFTLSGTLANYGAAPTLTYSDNNGAAIALPSGSTVTATAFSFLHPGLAAGNYSTAISDGSNAGSVSYTVTAVVGGVSQNRSFIVPGVPGSLNDAAGNRWTITSGSQVAVNGVVDATTSNVIELAWVAPLIWQENSVGLWFSKTSPAAAWSPTAGTTVNPLSGVPTITINAITTPAPNASFTITGSLANYTTAPALTYSDNGGAAVALPGGSTVTATAFSFVHPGMPAGTDSISISDGTNGSTASYSVNTSGWTSLAPTPNLSNTITGLAASTSYDIEVYASNPVGQGPASAILTVNSGGPPVVTPGAPTGLTSTAITQTSVTLTWTPPTTGTLPFVYTLRYTLHGGSTWTAGPTVSTNTAQITGLTANSAYDFEVAATGAAPTAPPAAGAVGYTVQTFGSAMTVGTDPTLSTVTGNWQYFNFYGDTWATVALTFNPDGSITIPANVTNSFGAQIASAGYNQTASAPYMSGYAFGGGGYFECTMSFAYNTVTGAPAFWANDIESMGGGSKSDLTLRHWPGQAAGYGDWIEVDMCEFDAGLGALQYGISLHNWYGTVASTQSVSSTGSGSPVSVPAGTDFTKPHKYGFLWVPATGSASPGPNILPNPTFSGEVVGTPGTIPTGWDRSRSSALSTQIVGIGTDGTTGLAYMDFRWFGTPDSSNGGNAELFFTALSGVACQPSTSYTQVAYIAMVAGSMTNIGNVMIGANDLTSGSGYISSAQSYFTPTGTLTQHQVVHTTESNAAFMPAEVSIVGLTSGLAVDITIRMAGLSLFITSVSSVLQGHAKWFFDDVQMGNTISWNKYDSTLAPPPVDGTSAYSILDQRHLALIIGNATATGGTPGPVTVYKTAVWQNTAANNLVLNVTPTPTPTQGPESAIYTVSTASGLAPTVTWSTIAGSMTLSNGNLTATGGGSTTPYAAHSVALSSTSLSAGKVAFEVTMSGITQNSAIGLVSATFPTADQIGADAESIGYYMSTGTGSQTAQSIYLNNVLLLSPSGNLPPADTAGAVFTFCVDLTAQLFWVTSPAILATYGAGAWNDSATASPATGAGGISFAGLTGGALSIAATCEEGGAVFTLNAGSSVFTRASMIPSTFPAWSGTTVVVVKPGAVTGLAAGTPSNISVPLSWTAPSTGTAPLTYSAMQSPHGTATYTLATTSGTTSATVTGLTPNTAYDFEVFASNSAGTGGNSNVVTATTLTVAVVPGAPVGLSAGTSTATSVPLTWAPPTTGGAPTGYQVQYKLGTASIWTNFSPTVTA
jgi:hypothetical protein